MRSIVLILLFFAGSFLNAQETGDNKWGAWYMYFGKNKISENLSIHSETQLRLYETTRNFNQLLLRTGLNYQLNPDAMATLGYGYIITDGSFAEFQNERNTREHRIFEQFIIINKVGEFLLEHRYRMEQRFLDFGADNDIQHRARYRLQITLPLTDIFFINVYDEVFLNLQDTIFGQNRLYAAVGIHISHNISIQIGYLKNHFNTINFDRLQIGVSFNPDLRGIFNKAVDESSN